MSRVRTWGPIDTFSNPSSLDRLWDVVNRRRSGTKAVTVEVDDLIALLKDHARFADVCKTNP